MEKLEPEGANKFDKLDNKSKKVAKVPMIELEVPSIMAYFIRKSKAETKLLEAKAAEALKENEPAAGRNLKTRPKK